jgi:hypothetical protein
MALLNGPVYCLGWIFRYFFLFPYRLLLLISASIFFFLMMPIVLHFKSEEWQVRSRAYSLRAFRFFFFAKRNLTHVNRYNGSAGCSSSTVELSFDLGDLKFDSTVGNHDFRFHTYSFRTIQVSSIMYVFSWLVSLSQSR